MASTSYAVARRSVKCIVVSFRPGDPTTPDLENRPRPLTLLVDGPICVYGHRDLRRLQYRFRLTRFTSRDGFRNLHEFPRLHVVDIAVYQDVIGNQRVVSNTHDILDHAFAIVGECQPVDITPFCRPKPLARVAPATLVQCRG